MTRTIARLTLFALLTAAVTAFAAPHAATAAPPPEGEMRLVAPAVVADGDTFTVGIEVVGSPTEGYFGFQERMQWGAGLSYLPSALLSDEVLSPHCSLPVRTIMGPTDLLIGCVNFPLPAAPFTDTGPAHRLTFTCHDPGGAILLTTGTNLDSIFVDAGLNEVPVALVNAVNVSCPRVDSDLDGCFDSDEIALGLDPHNRFDFSDYDHSGAVDAADIALSVQAFGTMNDLIDRTGDSAVSVGDVVRVVAQFGVSCPT